jgi:hypothetical protein
MNDFFTWLVFFNGIYDVSCSAVIILNQCPNPWNWVATAEELMHNYLHFSLFQDSRNMNPQAKRFLAYWVFTYGLIRITTALHSLSLSPIFLYSDKMLASLSYLIEALCFETEYALNSMHIIKQKMHVLIVCCICMWWTLLSF